MNNKEGLVKYAKIAWHFLSSPNTTTGLKNLHILLLVVVGTVTLLGLSPHPKSETSDIISPTISDSNNSVVVVNTNLDRSCIGSNCQVDNATTVTPNYPNEFFTHKMIFDLNYPPDIFLVKMKNVLFIKNDIRKKAFFEEEFPQEKEIEYGLCNDTFSECKVYEKYQYTDELKDQVCSVYNASFDGNCLFIIDLKETPNESCNNYYMPSNLKVKLNLLQGETLEQYDQRCLIDSN